MNSLFSKEHLDAVIQRIEQLTPESTAQWGKMNVSQMLSHCSATMEVARDQRCIKRMFIGYVLGGFMKKQFYNNTPVQKNSPTHPVFLIVDTEEFAQEQQRLIEHLRAFHASGPENCTKNHHAFFGKMSSEQWGMGMYKHTDHHLQQFGV